MMLFPFIDQISVRSLVEAASEYEIVGVGEFASRFLSRNCPQLAASWQSTPVESLGDPFCVKLLHNGKPRTFQLFSVPCDCHHGCDKCNEFGELQLVGEKFMHRSGSIYVVSDLSFDAESDAPIASRVLLTYVRQGTKFPRWTHTLENFMRPGRFERLGPV